ncbi:P22 phage major capsid protein family protein [Nocardia terpenica]|uniref:P22 coat protein-protein 5 domain protein n=1 Tax=Nocardia terpenica TaxID=455432 RepID=A0A6G9YZ89_9NOCA|nr:P22 phage major capsid protein family protein [Nocardia terpenica]QIS18534.1 P22 coat protein - protein 5 domain protein [Nocardia terpenica]
MPINFIPEFWSDQVLLPFEADLVFGQPKVANRKYEGTIREKGDTVHVSSIGDPTVKKYDKNTDLEIDDLSDSETAMVIDQGDYFAFRVNDIEKLQAAENFEDPATARAGYKLQNQVDLFLYNQLKAGVDAKNNLGRVTVTESEPEKATVGQLSMYRLAVKLREKLDRASVPKTGRYLAIPPELLSPLLLDARFINAEKLGSVGPLLNGTVGRMAGFDILESNNINKVGGTGAAKDDYVVIAGVSEALSFANQLSNVETLRAQNRFADIVRGVNIYGGKVFRPEGLASASVLLSPPATPAAA